MNKNNLDASQEIEKRLKEKMNELSSSVDCFDRICSKAFPEKTPDFSESGFTVSDLENVTGKSHKPRFFRLVSVAVACAVCAVLLPKTALVNHLTGCFVNDSKKVYSKIIEEINNETENNDYKIYDLPLDEYIKYDRLITPLYSCPFDYCARDNINVRIFVRTYDDIPTNQIYAVEYADEYKQSNFIAVADSGVKFTDDECKYIDELEMSSDDTEVFKALMANFYPSATAFPYISDSEENNISLASFNYRSIYKSDTQEAVIISTRFVYYGDRADAHPDNYYYDSYNFPPVETETSWKDTVRFDGLSSLPEESNSLFNKISLFNKDIDNDICMFNYISPKETIKKSDSETGNIDFCYMEFINYNKETIVDYLAVPYDSQALRTLKMYFSQSAMMLSSDSQCTVSVTFENSGTANSAVYDSDNYNAMLEYFEEINEQETNIEDMTEFVAYDDYRF